MTRRGVQQTSLWAYESIAEKLNAMNMAVYTEICKGGHYGASIDEVADSLGKTPNTISPRFLALRKLGMIEQRQHRRRTRAGRLATTWMMKHDCPGADYCSAVAEQTRILREGGNDVAGD